MFGLIFWLRRPANNKYLGRSSPKSIEVGKLVGKGHFLKKSGSFILIQSLFSLFFLEGFDGSPTIFSGKTNHLLIEYMKNPAGFSKLSL